MMDDLNSHHDAKPGKTREGRGETAFLGCKRKRDLELAVGLSGTHGWKGSWLINSI